MGAPGTNIYSGILARNQVFFDDMEGGDGNWLHDATNPLLDTWALTDTGPPADDQYYGPPYSYSGTWSFTDSPDDGEDFDYEADTDSWLGLFNAVDLYGQFGTKLTFWARYDLDLPDTGPEDFLWIEGSSQGEAWYNYGGLYGSSNGAFTEIHIDLSAHDNLPDFLVRFHLTSDSNGEHDGVYIDDVRIATHVAGDAYDYFQGTSMAAPHVAGLAGLIMAAFPGISNSEAKTRIINGVDPKSALVGMTVSGGRINAMRSLGIPIAPSALVAWAVSESQVDLTWTDNAGPPWTEEDGFPVYRKTEGDTEYTLIGIAAGVPGVGNAISFADTSVVPGQMYIYTVTAYNWYGDSSYSNESTALTPGGHGLTGSGRGSGGCFIATAAYGSPTARFIHLLRAFRDQYLLTNPIGKKWIDLYYRYSPRVAGYVADCPAMRKGVRLILFPFVALSAGMVHTTALQKGLILCFVGGFLAGMVLLSKRRILN